MNAQPHPLQSQPTLYDSDLSAWANHNAALLKSGQFDKLDVDNLIEELQDMGRSEKRALESYLQNLLMHLLKWQFQPEKRSKSWELSIKNGRHAIDKLLRDNPSLRPQLQTIQDEEYEYALASAAVETGLEESVFPPTCPFDIAQIQDTTFWP